MPRSRELRSSPETQVFPETHEREPQSVARCAEEATERMTRIAEGIPESGKKSILEETVNNLRESRDARLAAALVAVLNISYPFVNKHAEGEMIRLNDSGTFAIAEHGDKETPPPHHNEQREGGGGYISDAQKDASTVEQVKLQIERKAETIELNSTFPRAIRWERPVSRKYTEIDPLGEPSQYIAQLNELQRTFFVEVRAQIPELQKATDEDLAQLTDVRLIGESAASIEGEAKRNQRLSEIEATRAQKDLESATWQALGGPDHVTIQTRGVGEKVVLSEEGGFREIASRETEDMLMKKHHIRSRQELHRQVQISTGFTRQEKKMRDAFNARNPDRAADFAKYYTEQRGVFFDVAFQLRTPQLQETESTVGQKKPTRKDTARTVERKSDRTSIPDPKPEKPADVTIGGSSLRSERVVRDMRGEKGRVRDEDDYGLEKREKTPTGAPGPTEPPETTFPPPGTARPQDWSPRPTDTSRPPGPEFEKQPGKNEAPHFPGETPRIPARVFDGGGNPDIPDEDLPDKYKVKPFPSRTTPDVKPERPPVRVDPLSHTPPHKLRPRVGGKGRGGGGGGGGGGGRGGGGGTSNPDMHTPKDALYREKPILPEGIVHITGGQGDKGGHTRMKNRIVKGRI